VRVLFLNDLADPRIGSSVRQMHEHAAWLREQGHETLVVTATQDPEQVGESEIFGGRVHSILSDYNPRWRSWVASSRTSCTAICCTRTCPTPR
jgi:hypothetical protein